MATPTSSSSQPNSRANELCAAIKEYIYQHFDELRRVYEANRPTSYHQLLKKGLVFNQTHDQPFENIIDQLLATIVILDDNIQELEASCQKFLSAMVWFGLDPKKTADLEPIALSQKLRKKWRDIAAELGIQPFLSVETLPDEETDLLRELKVKPLENLIERPDEDVGGKRLQKNTDRHNKAALVVRKHCNEIIRIIADEKIAKEFVDTLCQHGLIRPARKNQILRISNPQIQAKGIMSAVCILTTTGIVPHRHLNTFVNALKQHSSSFKEVIKHIEKEGYTGRDDHDSMMMTVDQTDHCNNSIMGSDTAVAPADDPYVKYLHIFYRDNLTPAFFSKEEWKYYDLATAELSVSTIIPGLDQLSLDLKQLPQKYKSSGKLRSLIVGAPGVGKSSVITELCKGWVRGDRLQKYNYVIRIDASQGRNKVNKLENLIPCSTSTCIEQADGEKTLFIIDGFDEFNEENRENSDSFYNKMFQDKIPSLCKASLIVTARPQCANKIGEYFPAPVEILGFTDVSKDEYISNHLRANDRVRERLSTLRPTVEFCMNIPFLLATLIEIINDDSNEEISITSPETLTNLYGVLIRTHILYYARKNDLKRFLPQCAYRIEPEQFSSQLPQNIYIPFLKICALAYKLVSGDSTDDIDDLQYDFKLVTKLTEDNNAGQIVEYKFLHSSVQEYLAAYCISRMSDVDKEKSIRFLMDRFSQRSDQYNLVLEFLHGFKCIRQDHIHDCNQLHYKKVTSVGVIRQLCEMNSPEFIKDLYSLLNEQHRKEHGVNMHFIFMRSWPIPTPGDLWYLGRVIVLSGQCWEINFTFRPIRDAHLKMFCEGINSTMCTVADHGPQTAGILKKISLSLTKITKDGLPHIFKINRNCLSHIQDLRLDSIDLAGQDVIDLLSNSLPTLINLKRFLFHYNNISSHRELLIALAMCPCLKHVSFTDLHPEEYELLLRLPLKIIELWRISTISCEALFQMLPKFKTCEDLEIYLTDVSIDCARTLQQCLPLSKLKHLKLVNCGINDVIVDLLVEGVATYATSSDDNPLKSLDLCNNFITDVGGRKLLKVYQQFGIDPRETYLYNSFSDDVANKLEKIYEDYRCLRESTGEHASSYITHIRVGLEKL